MQRLHSGAASRKVSSHAQQAPVGTREQHSPAPGRRLERTGRRSSAWAWAPGRRPVHVAMAGIDKSGRHDQANPRPIAYVSGTTPRQGAHHDPHICLSHRLQPPACRVDLRSRGQAVPGQLQDRNDRRQRNPDLRARRRARPERAPQRVGPPRRGGCGGPVSCFVLASGVACRPGPTALRSPVSREQLVPAASPRGPSCTSGQGREAVWPR